MRSHFPENVDYLLIQQRLIWPLSSQRLIFLKKKKTFESNESYLNNTKYTRKKKDLFSYKVLLHLSECYPEKEKKMKTYFVNRVAEKHYFSCIHLNCQRDSGKITRKRKKNPYIYIFFLIISPIMLLRHGGVTGSEKEREDFGDMKRQKNRIQEEKMAIGVEFKFLKIVGCTEARNLKRVPQTGRAVEEFIAEFVQIYTSISRLKSYETKKCHKKKKNSYNNLQKLYFFPFYLWPCHTKLNLIKKKKKSSLKRTTEHRRKFKRIPINGDELTSAGTSWLKFNNAHTMFV